MEPNEASSGDYTLWDNTVDLMLKELDIPREWYTCFSIKYVENKQDFATVRHYGCLDSGML